jgi:hypothetical protein
LLLLIRYLIILPFFPFKLLLSLIIFFLYLPL